MLHKRIPGESATQRSRVSLLQSSSRTPPLSQARWPTAASSTLAGAQAHGGLVGSSLTVAGADLGQHGLLPSLSRSSWCHPSPIAASRVLAGLELCPCAAGAEGLPPRAMAECGEVSFPFLPFARLRPASARPGSSPSLFSRAQPGGKRGRRDPPRASSARGPARPLGQLRLEASASPSWRRPPSPLLIHAR
jgi:hypothetical protein